MLEDPGVRVARLAKERKLADLAAVHQQRLIEDLAHARRDANLYYLAGIFNRILGGFHRSTDPDFHIHLKIDDGRIYFLRDYSILQVLLFEPAAVRVQPPPPAGTKPERRFTIYPGDGISFDLIEDTPAGTPEAPAQDAEAFCEMVLALAAGVDG
jgi:hypothetical protein